jgi:hypothetical protein
MRDALFYFENNIFAATSNRRIPNIFFNIFCGILRAIFEPKYDPIIKATASIKANLIFTWPAFQ